MKKTNTILIILAILFWGIFFYQGNAQIHIPDSIPVIGGTAEPHIIDTPIQWSVVSPLSIDQKELEFNAVAPALLLLELYMHDLRTYNDSIINNSSPIMWYIKQPDFADFYDWSQEYFKEQLK
nr:hypothetical protein [uncultured Allomuricauda sp.]